MDKHGKRHAKWKKPDTNGHIVHLYEMSRTGNLERQKADYWVPWLAQSVGHVIPDLRVMSLSPMFGLEPT